MLLAHLAAKYRWSLPAAGAAIFGLASIISVLVWGEITEDAMFRLLGVVAILDGALTIVIPIFHRLSRGETETVQMAQSRPSLPDIDREIADLHSRIEELEQLREQIDSERFGNFR